MHTHAYMHMSTYIPFFPFSPSQFWLQHWAVFAADYMDIIYYWAQFSVPFLFMYLLSFLCSYWYAFQIIQQFYQIHVTFSSTFCSLYPDFSFDIYQILFILVCGLPLLLLNFSEISGGRKYRCLWSFCSFWV